jgi:hypothetical protein
MIIESEGGVTKRKKPNTPEEWLARLGLEDLWPLFKANGYKSVLMMIGIDDAVLDRLGIKEEGPRGLLKAASKAIKLPDM